MRSSLPLLVVGLTLCLAVSTRADTVEELLEKARAALKHGKEADALKLATKAIDQEPKNAVPWLVRGTIHESSRQHAKAVADFDKAIALDAKLADAYDRRGSEHFKLGHIKESVADFDKYLELEPERKNGHWKRGISLYYAGKFDDGRKQFEGYEKVDTNDVENAVWHFLCAARQDGVKKARTAILKIGKDKRVPMMQVYDLYAGKAKPADVLDAAKAGDPPAEQLNARLFYAHLYLGLYAEATGDKKLALEHLTTAADKHKIGHYMWDVAKVHRDVLKKQLDKDGGR
jgi:lipoprotein NlpI